MSEELSLSEELRRAREARDESLEQVHQRTGIALTILQELESGDYTVVEPVYARLAINHYASHLGLDGHAFETRLRAEVEATRPPPVEMRTQPQIQSQPLQTPSPVAEFIRSQPPSRLATIGVILVVGLAILLYLLGSDAPDPRTAQRPVKGPPPVAASKPQNAVPAAVQAPEAPAPQTQAPKTQTTRTQAPATPTPKTQAPAPRTPATQAPVAQVPASQPVATAAPVSTPVPQSDIVETEPQSDESAAALPGTDPVAAPASGSAQGGPPPVAVVSPVETTDTDPATDIDTPVSVPNSAPATAESTPAEGAAVVAGPLQLQVDALDSTWVQVQWDDEDGVVEIIPSGERRIWGAERFFMVRAGRAHGVHFHFQGELLGDGRLGDPTKVLRFRASAEGVQLLGPDLEPIGVVASAPPATDPAQPDPSDADPPQADSQTTPQPDIVEAAVQDRP